MDSMEGEYFEIHVSSSFMEDHRDALPDKIHGRAESRRPELFKLVLRRDKWRVELASGDGGLHIRRRSVQHSPTPDE